MDRIRAICKFFDQRFSVIPVAWFWRHRFRAMALFMRGTNIATFTPGLHCKKNLADKTVQEYTRQIENDIKPAFKNLAANEVTPQMIVQLIDTKARQAPIAANRILATVSKLFKWAKGRQSIETNPALGIEKPGKEKQRDRVLSEHEIRAFWEWTESEAFAVASNNLGDTTKFIFQLVLLTGQRPGEVCQISKHQIDYDARVWMIPDKVHKSGRVHMVPLSDAVMGIGRTLEGAGSARLKT